MSSQPGTWGADGLTFTDLPADFVDTAAEHAPERAGDLSGMQWLEGLPTLANEALQRWNLAPEHSIPLRWGQTAVVLPVRRPQGDPGMLKISWPHPEADHEHLALRSWKGAGAVRLYAADPASHCLLLERLDPERTLSTGSILETTEALGQVLRALDRPAPPWAPSLVQLLQDLHQTISRALTDPAITSSLPRRMVQHAQSLAAELVRDAQQGAGAAWSRLVHTDLHQGNVLWRPDPGEWVAIDPKVVAGDPHWAVAPALWNRWPDVQAAHDARAHLRLRLGLLCEAAGLDEDRARAMVILRLVQNALWASGTARRDKDETITAAVTIVKAMQD